MPARRGFSHRSRQRRLTEWGDGPGGTVVTQFTGSAITIIGAGVVALVGGLTIVRIRGLFRMMLQGTVGATGDGFQGALGMCVVSEDAFAVGATAIPDPVTDLSWDGWMYHQILSVHSPTAGASGLEGAQSTEQSFNIDGKAMRKFDESDVLVAIVQLVEAGTVVADVWMDSRVLVKLP